MNMVHCNASVWGVFALESSSYPMHGPGAYANCFPIAWKTPLASEFMYITMDNPQITVEKKNKWKPPATLPFMASVQK